MRTLFCRPSKKAGNRFGNRSESASTFIIVLWIAFGLVSVALYFGHAMQYELRASDNRVSNQAADQAIEGAVRYISSLLAYQSSYGSNGILPDVSTYLSESVPVGDARFWIIGRDTNTLSGQGVLSFGLIDEASKININTAPSNMLAALTYTLPNVNPELPAAIIDWRSTNTQNAYQSYYSTRGQGYQTKGAPFETTEELRLVYGGDYDVLVGEDSNRNGILDPNETDVDHNGQLGPGLLEYVTVYTREPNYYSNGTPRVNISSIQGGQNGPFQTLLKAVLPSRATPIMQRLGLITFSGGQTRAGSAVTFRSPLDLYLKSGMTSDEFDQIANCLTMTNGVYIEGRININTAPAAVLNCLPGFDSVQDLGDTIVAYRVSNPDKLNSIAWIIDALGQNTNGVLPALRTNDCLTTQTFQYTADIAAVGPYGRGYRRVRFVFDTSDGSPKVVYRQDLTHLGWALGKDLRESVTLANNNR